METERNFSEARGNGASRGRRPAAKVPPSRASSASWTNLKDTLHNLPAARPQAVARARQLIADPDFPSDVEQQIIAEHLAVGFIGSGESFST